MSKDVRDTFIFKLSENTDKEAFYAMLKAKYPAIKSSLDRTLPEKKYFLFFPQISPELVADCLLFGVTIEGPEFKETTFSASEMAALKVIVDYAAMNCGGGEDIIGSIMYTGAFHHLKDQDQAICDLARKLESRKDGK